MENTLSAAFQFHQRGCLDEAARIYKILVASNPGHADAHHLLGVVALQQGNPQRAVESISRAIALRSDVAPYHANLAEAYRMLGKYEAATGCCRTALKLQPQFPGARNNLGLSLHALGQTTAAIEQYRETLRIQPDFAMAHNNLAIALRSQGENAEAVKHFNLALKFAPNLAESHSNLGQLLFEEGRLQEALVHCREAVRLRSDFPEAHTNLGIVYRGLGLRAEAKACYAEALRLNPEMAVACNNMGQIIQEEGNLDESVAWYRRSLEFDPSSVLVQCNLATALKEQNKHHEAVAHYDMALRLDPSSADAHNGRGWVRHEQGDLEEALYHYRKAIQFRSNFALAHCNLGTVLEEFGEMESAERSFREALRHDPDHAEAQALLATLLGGKLGEAELAAMRRRVVAPDSPELNEYKRSALHFAMGHVLDARGDYAGAAEHLRKANALGGADWKKRGRPYDPAEHAESVTEIIETFSPAFFERLRGFALETEQPVFIVGLPRSGTTLTEQILAGHSKVHGAGELSLVRDTFESLPRILNVEASAVECLDRLDRETAQRLGRHILHTLRSLNLHALRIVDKMPENYIYLGMLTALFPGARFIHCQRDLRDIAVSCWMTHFRHIRWANDPDHIVSRIHNYQRLMDHWRQVLPPVWLDVPYEATVADLETVARQLVAWCGLEWEPECLAFHSGRRTVRSASLAQVRRPIYKNAVGRWKNYEHELGPMLAQFSQDWGKPGTPAPSKARTIEGPARHREATETVSLSSGPLSTDELTLEDGAHDRLV
jgi:tetratricopeptide (TPR) repeat protein